MPRRGACGARLSARAIGKKKWSLAMSNLLIVGDNENLREFYEMELRDDG
jgi:hypothetical protein